MAGVLIRSYGEMWSPDLADWGRRGPGGRGRLLGEFGGKRKPTVVDVWEQRGVYVLLHDWDVVYVGKADRVPLGRRIGDHLVDERAGRWDRFSWYGIRAVVAGGKLGAPMESKLVSVDSVISTLESLLIAVTEPQLNRRREEIPGAQLLLQHGREAPRPMAGYLDEIRRDMGGVKARLDEIESVVRRTPPSR